MPSELQRVAQGLLAALDEIPRIVAYLHDRASKYRESAGWVGSMSSNPSARMAAMQLDEAARRCEEAAHYLSLAPPKARSWAEQMVSGVRTAEPAGGSTARRPDAPGGSPPSAKRRRDDDPDKPEAKKAGKAADAGDETSPEDEPPTLRISDKQARDLQQRLPIREESGLSRPKTRGLWVDDDGQEHDLASGETDLYDDVKQFLIDNKIGRTDGSLTTPSHVEVKFAMFMRRTGRMHETISVNKAPCEGRWGCRRLLSDILPTGATLTVFGPNGFKETYPLPADTWTE